MLDRALGLPNYEKVWQQFLNARAAVQSSGPTLLSFSPEAQLALDLPGINPKAYTRAEREVGKDNAGAIVNWFIKNEGLGRKEEYEHVWQMYLSSLAKERQEQRPKPQPVVAPFLQQLAVAPIPSKSGASEPGKPTQTGSGAKPDPVDDRPTRIDSPAVPDVRGGRFAAAIDA